jgi:hypothetical protein
MMSIDSLRDDLSRVGFCLLLMVFPGVCCPDGWGGEYRLYWGDVHTHTNLSDGKGTPDQVLTYARDAAHRDLMMLP